MYAAGRKEKADGRAVGVSDRGCWVRRIQGAVRERGGCGPCGTADGETVCVSGHCVNVAACTHDTHYGALCEQVVEIGTEPADQGVWAHCTWVCFPSFRSFKDWLMKNRLAVVPALPFLFDHPVEWAIDSAFEAGERLCTGSPSSDHVHTDRKKEL